MNKNEKLIAMLPIKTDRLIIKATSINDIDLIMKLDKQEDTQMFLGGIKNKTKEERIKFLEKKENKFNDGIVGSLTVYLQEQVPIGFISFNIDEINNNAEISYIFDLDYCKKGYCTEACIKLLDIGFNDLGLIRIFADTIDGNNGSIKVLEKLGFKLEGVRRHAAYVNTISQYRNFLDYGLLATEYNK